MIIREYRKSLQEEDKKDTTIRNYISSLMDFKEFIRKPLRSVIYEDFDNYIWRLQENGLANRTINLKIGRIKKFYNFVKSKENVSQEIDKILDYEFFDVEYKTRYLFTEKHLQRIVHDKDLNLRQKATFILAFFGALDTIELGMITTKAFIRQEEYTKVKVKEHGNKKRRMFFIPNYYFDNYIQKIIDREESDYILYNLYTKEGLSTETFSDYIQEITLELFGFRLFIADIRRACYTHLYKQGVDIFTIMHIFNLKNINSLIKAIILDEHNIIEKYKEYLK